MREVRDDAVPDVAAGVAFWLLLSVPAALLAGLSSVSLVGDDLALELRDVIDGLVDRVLTTQADVLRRPIDELFEQDRPGVLSASLATAVFTLSRGFAGLVRGLDAVYDVEETRNFAHTRALSIGLAVGTLATVVASTALWSAAGDAGVPPLVRAPLALAVLVAWSATMFHIGPNHHTPWRYDVPGAVVAAVGWLALSVGFGWYVRLVGADGGGDVIGVVGAVLLGLTWMWAACVVFLVGGELNQILAAEAGVIGEARSVASRVRARRERR